MDLNIQRYKQLKNYWWERDILNKTTYDINEWILEIIWKDNLKEYVIKKIVKDWITMTDLLNLDFELQNTSWLGISKVWNIYLTLYNLILENILLPNYTDEWDKENKLKDEFFRELLFKELDKIINRVRNKNKKNLEKLEKKWFFHINIWNKEFLEDDFNDWSNNLLFTKSFNIWWIFWYLTFDYDNDNKYYSNIPLVIKKDERVKINDDKKEDNTKFIKKELIESFLNEYFDWKKWKDKTLKEKFKKKLKIEWDFTIKVTTKVDVAKNYWPNKDNDNYYYYIIKILNNSRDMTFWEEFDTISESLEEQFKITSFIINTLAKKSEIEHKKNYVNFTTEYAFIHYSDDEETALDKKYQKYLVQSKEPTKLEDIWWQKEAKEEIQNIIESIKHETIMKSWWAKTTSWIIFEWPPWTWKTLLAKAIATEVNAEIYNIKLTDIADSAYINEWANNVKELFQFLREKVKKTKKKVIVILDELDALFKKRGNSRNDSWEDTKIVNTFLTEMSGLEELENIIFIWTTNLVEKLDPAIIRSGRMSTKVKVDNPDLKAREEIFKIHIGKAIKKSIKAEKSFNWIDYKNLSSKSNWLSGADIEEVIRLILQDKAIKEVNTWKIEKIETEEIIKFIKKVEKYKEESSRTLGFIKN